MPSEIRDQIAWSTQDPANGNYTCDEKCLNGTLQRFTPSLSLLEISPTSIFTTSTLQ